MCSDDGPVATDLPTQVPAVDSFVPAGQVHPGGGAAAAAADSCRLHRAHLRGDQGPGGGGGGGEAGGLEKATSTTAAPLGEWWWSTLTDQASLMMIMALC